MKPIHIYSEIGRLKKVLLHRPGTELENIKPEWLERLLFDDIPWLEYAQKEHDEFALVFQKNGIEVLYLEDLIAETLEQSEELKAQFIQQFLDEAHVTSETLREVVTDYLYSFSNTKAMIEKTMGGIRKNEVPNFQKRTLSDYISDYPFVSDPMPNLYFTRDPFSSIGNGVTINRMSTLTRSRETIYADYIFKYHHIYGKGDIPRYYDRNMTYSLEGGDILVLTDKVIAVGVSERTHPSAIELFAKNLFYKNETSFEIVLAFDIPKTRAFMHLDTVFTRVDYDKFTLHSQIDSDFRVYELTRDLNRKGKIHVKPIVGHLDEILRKYTNQDVILIPCGGGDEVISGREQWNDGANTLAIAPGEVIVYARNYVTNEILDKHGVKVHPILSSELSRGRGGPRCMSMPLIREDV
ncbi:MAG TPA: arginine deiminase [Haloplasmataceae bacterium]